MTLDKAIRLINYLQKLALVFYTVLTVASCSSMPSMINKSASFSFQDASDTKLGHVIQPLVKDHDSKNGLLPLAGGIDAFTARYILANAAECSID